MHNICGKMGKAVGKSETKVNLRNTPDQDAVIQLAKEAKRNGGFI